MVILAFVLSLAANASDQLPVCYFYSSKAKELKCDTDNYLYTFGDHYCRAFVQLDDEFSAAGKKTFGHIRKCLIDELKKRPELSCDNARELAENSHVVCYENSGYCDLPAKDKWVVFKTVWTEFFDSGFREVMAKIRSNCKR